MTSGPVVGFVGWTPASALEQLRGALTPARRRGRVAAASTRRRTANAARAGARNNGLSRSLVDTYGTVPYADVDPSRIAGFAYVVMFGMMFGDVGQGAVLVLAGLILRTGHPARFAKWKRIWLFITGAGITSVVFGALYGEAFGPTGLVPVLWLSPLRVGAAPDRGNHPRGGVLAVSYAVGTVNRVREGGWAYALYARTGVAGSVLFVAAGALTLGLLWSIPSLVIVAVVLAVLALGFIFVGLYVDAGGGGTGIVQAVIELFDTVVRLARTSCRSPGSPPSGSPTPRCSWWSGTGPRRSGRAGGRSPPCSSSWSATCSPSGSRPSWRNPGPAARVLRVFSRIFDREGRPFQPWAPEIPTTPTDPTTH
ncbi:MAG: V-type ATPase 116kDa subunit family protein [Galbitalea sp.]